MSHHRNIVGVFVAPCLIALAKCLTKEIILAHSSSAQSVMVGETWGRSPRQLGPLHPQPGTHRATARAAFHLSTV